MEFYQIYNPLTAHPFECSQNYMEFIPCHALKPYIKCFWGTPKPIVSKVENAENQENSTREIITPDTCMDIIFRVNFTENRIQSSFCGIDDRTFSGGSKNDKEEVIFTFGIRFYAWSGILFAEESMRNTRNQFFDAGYHFDKIKRKIEAMLFDVKDMEELIAVSEKILLEQLKESRKNSLVTEAVGIILANKGRLQAEQLSKELHISNRQLERVFQEYIGISPKSLSAMVRYQYLWNDILFTPQFNILDGVHKYGYTDQSHLLRDFKKFHSINIAEAKRYAMKDVAFLQDKI